MPKHPFRYRLASLSIRARLIAMISGTVLVVVIASGWLLVQHDLSRLKQQLIGETQTASQVLAQDFARLLLLDSPDIAADVVARLSAFPMVLHTDVYSQDGRVALRYTRDPDDFDKVDLPQEAEVQWLGDRLIVRAPVEYDRSQLGYAIFSISTDKLQARLASVYRLLGYILPSTVLLILVTSYILQRSFSRPIIELAAAVKSLAHEPDYRLRLKVKDESEFGQLFAGFNRMIDTIEQSTQELNEQKAHLQVTLQSIPDGVITTDLKGRVLYMNPVAEKLCDIEFPHAKELPINKLFRLRSCLDKKIITNPVFLCLEKGECVTVQEECDLIRHDSETIGIKQSAAPIYNAQKELIGVIAVLVDISLHRALSEELTFQASHDTLTGLLNRRAFEKRLGEALETALEYEEQHMLFYMDLDQFKVVNDTCGHAAGDDLLKQLSQLLRTKVRSGDSLARLGGDEFGLILKHCPQDRALLIAEEILNSINDFRFEWMGKVYSVGISIGTISLDRNSDNLQKLMANADAACFQAKDQGRNRVCVYHEEDEDMNRRRGDMAFVSRLRRVIDEGRFVIFYQPIEGLNKTLPKSLHYEVLLRMQDEDNQLILPGTFMPAAERYGLIEQIDRWVVTNVIKQLTSHPQHLEQLDHCSINLSGISISQEDFLDFLVSEVSEIPHIAHKLCFEITETATIGNMSAVTKLMRKLRQYGIKFSLDDFGTGMSSLSYLKNLPVDYVKIDGVFVRDILDDPIELGMVKAINELAHVMGKQTIAEFVETEEVCAALERIGVDFAQGYLLGKPQPLSQLLESCNSPARRVL